MCLKLFELLFILLGIISILQMILLEKGITKHMTPMKSSDFVSSVAIVLLLYIFSALILAFLVSGAAKIFMLIFAAIPFVLGKFAEYKTHKKYTSIQLFIIFCSIIYTVYLFI